MLPLRLLRSLLIASLVALPAAAAHADQPATIRIGVAQQGAGDPPTFGGSSAATVQLQQLIEKEFAADGIKVQWLFFKGAGPAVNEAIANKAIDFAYQGDLPAVLARSNGIKTHLLLAIGQTIRHNNPGAKIAYVKGEEFVNQMVKSIGTGTAENFRQKYRNADLLLMDDIQFIAGKDSTQEEFFHTFNCLYEAGKQIVVTSDRPPKEMKRLNDRLCSRLEGGLLADVQPPDLETRTAIIRTKAAQFGMVLSEEVVQYIAENITSNVRQLEGVVKRLTAYRDILDDTITVDSVKRAIKDVIRTGTYIPTPDVIIEESARSFQLSGADLRGQSRSKKTAMARQIAMYLMRNLTNLPLKEIGEEFGGRNHATVLSSIRKVEELLKSDPEISATVRDITSNINSKN